MDICIVCHTEFGHVNGKEIIYGKDINGTRVGVPNLIRVAKKYNAKISFAVMPEVAEYFPKDSEHEIGLHIHPGWSEYDRDGEHWCIGDAYIKKNCRQSINSVGLMNYAYEEQHSMIRAGKEYITDLFGREPRVFVSGCWSVNNDTTLALVEEGFTHDCSPIPHVFPGIYDWSRLPRLCLPYRPAREDYQSRGGMPLLIVPTSQTLVGGYVSPEVVPALGIKWLKACFMEYYTQNIPLFNICLHSPSMTSDYYLRALDELLKYVSRFEVDFKFISEIKEYDGINPGTNIFPYMFGVNQNIVNALFKKILSEEQKMLAHRHAARHAAGTEW